MISLYPPILLVILIIVHLFPISCLFHPFVLIRLDLDFGCLASVRFHVTIHRKIIKEVAELGNCLWDADGK